MDRERQGLQIRRDMLLNLGESPRVMRQCPQPIRLVQIESWGGPVSNGVDRDHNKPAPDDSNSVSADLHRREILNSNQTPVPRDQRLQSCLEPANQSRENSAFPDRLLSR